MPSKTKGETDIARETMVGDLRDLALDQIKKAIAWKAFAEAEQQTIIDAVSQGAQRAVDRCVEIIRADGADTIPADIESLQIKDGIKLVLRCARLEKNLVELGNRQGSTVMILLVDSGSYSGTRSDVHPDPDQPDLPLNGKGKIGRHSKRTGAGTVSPACLSKQHNACPDIDCQCECGHAGRGWKNDLAESKDDGGK